jgi:hypothetical protein
MMYLFNFFRNRKPLLVDGSEALLFVSLALTDDTCMIRVKTHHKARLVKELSLTLACCHLGKDDALLTI